MMIFDEQKFLILTKSNLSVFSFTCTVYNIFAYPNQSYEDILLYYLLENLLFLLYTGRFTIHLELISANGMWCGGEAQFFFP